MVKYRKWLVVYSVYIIVGYAYGPWIVTCGNYCNWVISVLIRLLKLDYFGC